MIFIFLKRNVSASVPIIIPATMAYFTDFLKAMKYAIEKIRAYHMSINHGHPGSSQRYLSFALSNSIKINLGKFSKMNAEMYEKTKNIKKFILFYIFYILSSKNKEP